MYPRGRWLGLHGLGLRRVRGVVLVSLLRGVAGSRVFVGVVLAEPLVLFAEGVDDGRGDPAPLLARVARDPSERGIIDLHRRGVRGILVVVSLLGGVARSHGLVRVLLAEPFVLLAQLLDDGRGYPAPFVASGALNPVERLFGLWGRGLLLAPVLSSVDGASLAHREIQTDRGLFLTRRNQQTEAILVRAASCRRSARSRAKI